MAKGGVRSLNPASLIEEIRGVLFKNTVGREFKLIHAGVAGAFQQKVWIHRQEEGLGPGTIRFRELGLRC